MATRDELQSQSNQLAVQIAVNKDQFDAKLAQLRSLQNVGENTSQVEIDLDNLRQQNADLNNNLNLNNRVLDNLDQSQNQTSPQKSPGATNPDNSAQSTQERYQNAGIVGATGFDEFGDLEGAVRQQQNTSGLSVIDETGAVNPNLKINPETGELYTPVTTEGSSRSQDLMNKGIGPGAEKMIPNKAEVQTITTTGKSKVDHRVRIRVPEEYISNNEVPGNSVLKKFNGIIFPYTPQISFEYTANYQSQQPMHSNFALNFYQRSFMGNIQITADFTVQNDQDAAIYLGTVHLLSALTKMKFGNDRDAGAPPPVCRLDGYGTYMIKNIPISISNFRIDLQKNYDYYLYTDRLNGQEAKVPIMSQINLTCVLMYSRREMQQFTVNDFLNSYVNVKNKGFM